MTIMANMQKSYGASLLLVCFLSLYLTAAPSMAKEEIPIGLILDLDSSLGAMANKCIEMGLQDFYSHRPHYETRLSLHVRNSEDDVVTAASAALDLVKTERVHAILGLQNSEQARFVADLGIKAQVPVIWFSPTGPSLSRNRTQFIKHTSQSHCFQFKAIAAIVESYAWQAIIPIYENTEYGKGQIPCLTDALREMGIQMPYRSAIDPDSEDEEILEELDRLKGMQTQVFLVHMTIDLGSKLIRLAQKAEMMQEGYAWIVTQGLSRLVDPTLIYRLMGYMQGALGVRTMVPQTKSLKDFQTRWKDKYPYTTQTLFGLWAYDTIQALAIAVEEAGIVSSTFDKPNISNKGVVDLADVEMHGTGPKLLNIIEATNFTGVSGNFSLAGGQLEPSVLEVYNVIGQRERIIGFWSPQRGLIQNISDQFEELSGKDRLKLPMWQGDPMEKPTKLRIGVPVKENFTEFLQVERGSRSSKHYIFGFSFQVFLKAVDVLPYPLSFELVPLTKKNGVTAGNYDDLLCNIKQMKLDAIIGDITILANRTKCVDFTMPYLESSVSMMVAMRSFHSKWVLLQPFNWLLWLILGGIFVGATFTIIILERNKNKNDVVKKDKFNEMVRFPFSIYTSDNKELASGLSRWMVILTSFLLIIIVQVYTANLTSILTEGTEPMAAYKDVEVIKRKNLSVGYQTESWVKRLLVEQIGLNETQLKPLGTREEYNDALSKGSENGGVAAIFDETPYLMLFLSESRYGSYYGMAGPIYTTGGFGFAFQQKSNLVSNFSTAILNVTQDVDTFYALKNKYSLPTTVDATSGYHKASKKRSLIITDFGGLFPLVLYILGLFFSLAILKTPSVINFLRPRFRGMLTRVDKVVRT